MRVLVVEDDPRIDHRMTLLTRRGVGSRLSSQLELACKREMFGRAHHRHRCVASRAPFCGSRP
jgi:hypothetical protein